MRTSAVVAGLLGLGLAVLAEPAVATPPSTNRVAEYGRLLRAAMAQPGPSARGAVADLISRARAEQDPLLHRMMVSNLVRQKMPLLRVQKKEILGMARDKTRGLLPKTPPIPSAGTIEVRHYTMSGFLEPDLQHMRDAGFQVTRTPGGAEATRGRIHVKVRQGHQDILRDLADPQVHMVVYNGHSQLGGVVEQALQQPNLQAPAGRKLVALFQCSGTQTLPFLKTALPNVDVITSTRPLYVNETPDLMAALYKSVERGDGYHKMCRELKTCAWNKDSLIFPNQSANLRHFDFEPNGVLDINDERGLLQTLQGPARGAATGLMSGVHFLTSMNPYYVKESAQPVFRADQVAIPLVARGLARSGARGPSVACVSSRKVDGKRRFEVTLDPRYADASRTFVGAAAVFDVQMALQREFVHGRVQGRLQSLLGRESHRDKLRALAFAADYLDVIPRDSRKAQEAFDRLTEMHGLPKLSLWRVQSTLGGHVVNETAIDRLDQLVQSARSGRLGGF